MQSGHTTHIKCGEQGRGCYALMCPPLPNLGAIRGGLRSRPLAVCPAVGGLGRGAETRVTVFRLQASEDGFDGHARWVGGRDPLRRDPAALCGQGRWVQGIWAGGDVGLTGGAARVAGTRGRPASDGCGRSSVLSRVPALGSLPPYTPVPPYTALSPAQVHTHVPRSSGSGLSPRGLELPQDSGGPG